MRAPDARISRARDTRARVKPMRTADPNVHNSLGARIFRALRCTCQVRAWLGARISCLPRMHTYKKIHAPLGVVHASCCQVRLQSGVLLPQEPMLGVLFPRELM